jgi:hypothetical protein
MFSYDYVTPEEDDHQDVDLLDHGVVDGKRYFTFERDIKPCDTENDFDIVNEPQRIMWAYGLGDSGFSYHSAKQRGTEYVNLLNSAADNLPDEGIQIVDLLMNKYPIPPRRTTYVCQQFEIPHDVPYHMIKFEPITDSKYMHHIIAMGCGKLYGDEIPVGDFEPFTCNMLGAYMDYDAPPKDQDDAEEGERAPQLNLGSCSFDIMMGTAVRSNAVQFPDEAGRLVGKGASKYIMMQMHYDNVDLEVGDTDSSGLRMYITPNLREHNIGSLLVGDTVFKLPGGDSSVTVINECPGDCTARMFPEEGITVTNFIVHQHLFGKSIWTTHVREGRELQEIGRSDYWDFSFQPFERSKKGIVVKPGDSLHTTCIFDTKNRPRSGLTSNDWKNVQNNGLTFGESTTNEMCINIIMYYPQLASPQAGMGVCQDTSQYVNNTAVCAKGTSSDMGGFASQIVKISNFNPNYEKSEKQKRVCAHVDDESRSNWLWYP